ncbi:hypothetical protein GGI21_005504, partial [Coemansia aciculifera]
MARGRGTSEGLIPAQLRRRRSIDSYRSRSGSENPNLANVISHYMHGIDAESTTDMMAARYYGNMAQIPEDADRLPRPMNSTLPLFSLSVMNSGRNLSAQSPHGSDESSQRRSSRFARARTFAEGAPLGLSPVSAPGPKADMNTRLDECQLHLATEEQPAELFPHNTVIPTTHVGQPSTDLARDEVTAAESEQAPIVQDKASSEELPAADEIPHHSDELRGMQALPPDTLSYLLPPQPQIPVGEQVPGSDALSILSAPAAASSSMRRLSLGSCAFVEANERMDGLGVRTGS